MSAPRHALPLLLAAALVSAGAGVAPKAKPAAPGSPAAASPANAKVVSVQDRRTSGSFAACRLGVELPDFPASEVKAARVVVTKAVDDLGTNLLRDDAAEARLEPTQRGQFGEPEKGKPQPPTIVFPEMKNPPRRAKTLKEVAGELELFVPSRDPNGAASVPKFLTLAGRPLSNAALSANGVEVSILSKAQVAAERKKAEDAERAKAKKDGVTDPDTIRSIVDSELYSFPKGEEGEVVLRVKDPRKAIQEIKVSDAEGNRVFGTDSEEKGFRVLKFWNDKPKPDWTLRVEMRTAKSLVRQTFVFRDVPLP